MTAPKPKYAVVNSVPGSNYTQFQIKVWNTRKNASELHSDELFPTRIAAKKAVDNDPKLTRVDSFRVARERVTGVAIPPKRVAVKAPAADTFASALADSLSQYAATDAA